MDQLKTQLAAALDIDPTAIMHYRKEPTSEFAEDTYTVLLTTYQKFTAVQPAEPVAAVKVPDPAREPPIPDHLQQIYGNPARGTKNQLLQLAEVLGLDPGEKPTKKTLIALIEQSKTTDSPESANPVAGPEAADSSESAKPVAGPEAADSSESANLVARPGHMQAHDATVWEEA